MGLTIGVAGATGALGKELVTVLDEAPWRPDKVVPLASRSTAVSFVDYGGEQVAVDELEHQAMEDLDALILAVPSAIGREAGERAVQAGIPVIDCSGAFAGDAGVPLVIPWVNPEALVELPLEGVVAIPSPEVILLASVLGPLRRAGVRGAAEATVLLPASVWGRAAIEELSAQVIALFNAGTPPRKVFEHGLAFDLLPLVQSANEDGWTQRELDAAADLGRITGADRRARVTLVGVPVFSGISATLRVHTDQSLDLALLRRVLSDGGVKMHEGGLRTVPRPRRVDGQAFAHAGRLREDPFGEGFHLWATMDNLRGASTVAVATAGALLKRLGLLDN